MAIDIRPNKATSLTQHYNKLIQDHELQPDDDQRRAVIALAALSERLNNHQALSLIKIPFNKPPYITGIYFHGRVGRGKTMLMDLFYQHLTIKRKKRIHFHRFMQNIHLQLSELKGLDNPLNHIAKAWKSDIDVLCFDEFFVNDIADAMLLAGLLQAMFSFGITLIATSNCMPSQLYRNGLQRDRFLPTIDLINRYCRVISIDGDYDYRLSQQELSTNAYRDFHIKTNNQEQFLAQHFTQLAIGNIQQQQMITLHGRQLPFIGCADNVIWFDFMALCSGPRSQIDYIKLSDMFDVVLVGHVPQFRGELVPAVFSGVEDNYQRSGVLMGQLRALDDEARRFIALVDEFYDRGTRLIIEADVGIAELYQGEQLAFEFARCQSRLFEMQRLTYTHDAS